MMKFLFISLFFPFLTLAVTLNPTLDGSDKVRYEKYLKLAKKAELVVNSQEFKAKVLAFKFTSTKQEGSAVYAKMMAGSELLKKEANGVWDWKVGFYYKKGTKVIGWTNGKIMTVWVNTAKFDVFSDGDIIANIVHEYLHKIGYDHSSASDLNSVPYGVGYLARDLSKLKLAPGATPAPLPPILVVEEPPVIEEPKVEPKPEPAPIKTKPKMSWWARLISIFR